MIFSIVVVIDNTSNFRITYDDDLYVRGTANITFESIMIISIFENEFAEPSGVCGTRFGALLAMGYIIKNDGR